MSLLTNSVESIRTNIESIATAFSSGNGVNIYLGQMTAGMNQFALATQQAVNGVDQLNHELAGSSQPIARASAPSGLSDDKRSMLIEA